MSFTTISFDQIALALMTCLAVREALLFLRAKRASTAALEAPKTATSRVPTSQD